MSGLIESYPMMRRCISQICQNERLKVKLCKCDIELTPHTITPVVQHYQNMYDYHSNYIE